MTDLYKNKYRSETTRLKKFDYSLPGAYFITICTRNQEHYFGEIIDGKMVLSEFGRIADLSWHKIPKHFRFVSLDEYIIMPNHIHGIILIECSGNGDAINHGDAINRISTGKNGLGGVTKTSNPMLNTRSLSSIIRWYKGHTTFTINNSENQTPFAWQPRFHEHIIRNEESLSAIRNYIFNNPINWEDDEENPEYMFYKIRRQNNNSDSGKENPEN